MTTEELLILAAKDQVSRTHGMATIIWSGDTWYAAIKGVLNSFTDETVDNIKKRYSHVKLDD